MSCEMKGKKISVQPPPCLRFLRLRASFGDGILMVVLDEKMPLRDVHDLGEALQYSIESLEGVERAFVHCDYTVGNPGGHIRRGR
jgi:hypothetical protein